MPEAPVPRPKRVKSDAQALLDDRKGIVPLALRNLPRILTAVTWLIVVAALVGAVFGFWS